MQIDKRQILNRLNKADEHNRAQFESLATENKKRAEEIEQLGKILQFTILTETRSSHHSRAPIRSEDSDDNEARTARDKPHNPPAPGRMGPQSTAEASDPLRAQEAIELVDTRGQDDISIEDFINPLHYAETLKKPCQTCPSEWSREEPSGEARVVQFETRYLTTELHSPALVFTSRDGDL